MPDSETFDAFYARTVWNVTSQMHELAGDDGLADHAIREAYAKAYQQWYQVSRSRDSEAWVLATAKDAYERRRADAVGFGSGAVAEGNDSGTWPGFFRPRAEPGGRGESGADPEATVAAPRRSGAAGGDGTSAVAPDGIPASRNYPAAGAMAGDVAAGNGAPWGAAPTREGAGSPPGWFSRATRTAQPTRGMDFDGLGTGELGPGAYGGRQGPGPSGRNGLGGGLNRPGGGGLNRLATRRNLIVAGVVVAALVVVGITYAFGGGHNAPTPAATGGTSAKSAGKPKPHMLAAGRTGQRSAIPWSLVGSGWALAEVSTAAPNSAGQASGGGSHTTYLVDPEGGKYTIAVSPAGSEPQLMAWSGDAQTALFNVGGNGSVLGTSSYQLLNVRTGQQTPLRLPAGVVAIGFTRPDGLNILAVHQGPAEFRLQRYSLTGQFQASLASLPRKAGETLPSDGCSAGCAISSPDGDYAVWGIAGDEMQLVSNAGGKAIRLHVKDSGHPPSCVPISWWNDSTILADCAAAGAPDGERLWLVPDDKQAPTALTPVVSAVNGGIRDAWQAGQTTYVTLTTSHQCSSAPSGPGGLDIVPLSQGTSAAITIPGSTNNVSTVVATQGKRLLVLTQTQCPGTSSLLWFNPSTGHSQPAIRATSGEVGVIAAVPFGNGPTAVTNGY